MENFKKSNGRPLLNFHDLRIYITERPHPNLLPRGEGIYFLSHWERIKVRVA
jgi:hypothetical protein